MRKSNITALNLQNTAPVNFVKWYFQKIVPVIFSIVAINSQKFFRFLLQGKVPGRTDNIP